MSDEEALKRVKELEQEDLALAKTLSNGDGETAPIPDPVDVYEVNRQAQLQEKRTPRPKGAPSIVSKAANDAVNERLAKAYKKAKADSDYLKAKGEPERAKLVRDQYMQEQFLPVVESLIMFASPDEVLNAKTALNLMDQYVLNEVGGNGYTASYIRTAYKGIMGNSRDLSDPTVKQTVIKIKLLSDKGNVRAACGLAKRIKDKIDNGEHIASDADYDLVSRVSVFL